MVVRSIRWDIVGKVVTEIIRRTLAAAVFGLLATLVLMLVPLPLPEPTWLSEKVVVVLVMLWAATADAFPPDTPNQ